MNEEVDKNQDDIANASTIPKNYQISLRGFAEHAQAEELGYVISAAVNEIGRTTDVSNLDGITIAFDYDQALLDLDRGYPTNYALTKSTGDAIGVAMTPSVIRDGKLKSHILINAELAQFLTNVEHEYFRTALHTLAHECAHVEVTERFDKCFPNYLLKHKHASYVLAQRWEVILACWDEYAVTRICAGFGEDPTEGYESTFITQLASARSNGIKSIKSFRTHADVDRLLSELFKLLGNLLKFTSYHIGNMKGYDIVLEHRAQSQEALSQSWFEPYFNRLSVVCDQLFNKYGQWEKLEEFEPIADIYFDMLEDFGVHVVPLSGGTYYVNVPFSAETMP